jgi:hypothetical protein
MKNLLKLVFALIFSIVLYYVLTLSIYSLFSFSFTYKINWTELGSVSVIYIAAGIIFVIAIMSYLQDGCDYYD